jgi:transposase
MAAREVLLVDDLFMLSEAQMRRIAPYFPLSHGIPRVDDRRIISGIIFVIQGGLRWRDALGKYGPRDTIFYRQSHKIEIMFGRPKDWRRIHTQTRRSALTRAMMILAIAVCLHTRQQRRACRSVAAAQAAAGPLFSCWILR